MQTFHMVEHGDGVQISWTMLVGTGKAVAATVERPPHYHEQPQPVKIKYRKKGKT